MNHLKRVATTSNDDFECVTLQLCLFSGTIATVQCPMVIGFIGNQPGYGFFEGRIDDVSRGNRG